MKKLFTTWLLLAIAVLGFQAKADLWLIGELSPYLWVPNQGVQFTLVSGNDYTLDLNVTSTGDKYFALTTQLASSASDWDAIKPYRFGGQGYVVTLGEDLALVAGDDHSPKVNIPAVGVYTIKFNTSTRVINISRKDGDDTPEFVMPDFCTWQDGKNFVYIEDTNNWGASGINIYTWNGYDNGGWPGQANVNSTPVGQYEGHNVYLFDVPTSTPGNLIISNNGNNRFTGGNLNWVNGGYYNAGGMQGVVEQTTPTEPAWFIAGSFTDPAWADGKQALTKGNDGSFSITIPGIEDGAEFKFIDQDNKWYGGDTGGNEGNYGVHKDWCTDIDLAQGDNGSNFQVSGGGDLTFTISADKKLTITGWAEPTPEEPTLYVLGDFQNWKPNAGQELTYDENTKLFGGTVTLADEGFIKFTTKLQETEEWGDLDNYLIGAVSDGDFVMTQELLGEEIALEAQGDAIKLPAGEWTLSADIENNKLVITGTWPETPVLEDTLYIAGSFTDPAWADGKVMMTKNDTAFVYTINGAEEGMEFKFIDREGNWYGSEAEGESFWLNSEVSEATLVTPGKNFYINGTGNLVVTVSLDKTTVSVTGWDAAPAVEITAVDLRGSKNEWAEPIATFEVKNASTGYWELNDVEFAANEEFKIHIAYSDNTEKWLVPESNDNFLVTTELLGDTLNLIEGGTNNMYVDAAATLSFLLNPAFTKLVITGEIEGIPAVEITAVDLRGSKNEWAEPIATFEVKNASTGYWELNDVEFAANEEFKIHIAYSDNTEKWLVPESNDNFLVTTELLGDTLNLVEGGTNNMYVDAAATLSFLLNPAFTKLVITGEIEGIPAVEITAVELRGSKNEWAEPIATFQLQNASTGYRELNNVEFAADEQFKIRVAYSDNTEKWFMPESEGNFLVTTELLGDTLNLVEGGGENNMYVNAPATLSFLLNPAFTKLIITGEIEDQPVVPEDTLYIAGSFTDPVWADGKVMMTKNDTAFVYTLNGAEEGMEFKFIDREGNWYGGDAEGESFWLNNDVSEAALINPGKNFYINGTGNLVITVNLDKTTVTVTGWDEPTPVEPALYVLGNFQNWKPNAGQAMTYDAENKVFTTTITSEAETYFKFTTKLSETEEWTIDEYLWGAETNEDFEVTEALLGTELTLRAKGGAFKIAAGEWNMTADLENGTLVITKSQPAFQKGDVNGDGIVNGSDVTALYNVLLDDAVVAGEPDVNGDGVVSGSDVTALYNILLGD